MKYCSTSLAMKIIRDATPTSLYQSRIKKEENPVWSTRTKDRITSMAAKGSDWINLMLKQVSFPWINLPFPFSNDRLKFAVEETLLLQLIYFLHILDQTITLLTRLLILTKLYNFNKTCF